MGSDVDSILIHFTWDKAGNGVLLPEIVGEVLKEELEITHIDHRRAAKRFYPPELQVHTYIAGAIQGN